MTLRGLGGLQKNQQVAIELLKKAADKGHARATTLLSQILFTAKK